jgi:hypothetical protein|tara:strand:- start:1696 stop:2214 length:519 start_codon:yes stop_codon:yes gene_type:complete
MDFGKVATQMGDLFINLSTQYSAILNFIFLICACAGVFISISGIFTMIRAGDRQKQQPVWSVVAAKVVAGASLIELSMWANAWSATIWANTDPLEISAYSSASGDYTTKAMYAALGMMAIAGYVAIAMAYFQISGLGNVSQEGRGSKIGSILSRLVAGSALISAVHLIKYFE